MITSIKKCLCLLAVASAGFLTQANAQHRGGDNRGSSAQQGRSDNQHRDFSNGGGNRGSSSRPDMNRQTTPGAPSANRGSYSRPDNTNRGSFGQNNNRGGFDANANRGNTTPRTNTGLDRQRSNNTFDRQRTNPGVNNNNSRRFDNNSNRGGISNNNRGGFGNNNNRGYSNNNRGFNNSRYGTTQRRYDNRSYSGYRNYAPRRYVYVGAPRYSIVPHGSISINFGGYPYYYNSGLFYSYYDGYYSPVFAPRGIHISVLPFGYYPFYVGPTRYYYYSGTYYRDYDNGAYEVVDAPMGAQVSALPKGATVAVVNGEKFYEFNGTYYREETNSKNEVVYTVVGKNGEINNSDDAGTVGNGAPITTALHIGDVIPDLPEGSRPVTIDGESLYVSPDNTYFRQQVTGNEVSYQVVGMAEGTND
jgi:hypothetical protein